MDRIDYTFKFSTEILVLGLSFIVIGINAAGAQNLRNISINNLFSKELAYHPTANKLLYNKTTAVTTIVADDNRGFIPSASAQVVLASDQAIINPNAASGSQSQDAYISDNSITRPNPDGVRAMILQQIKNYTVQPGDTLSSIAAKFNLSVNTIAWANNIQNGKISPGQNLQILPVDGVIHTVTQNETLPDIAKIFKADEGQIISYNNLADDSDINPGDILIIPGGTVPPPPTPKQPTRTIKHTLSNGSAVYEPAPVENFSGGHLFPYGQCTYYVALQRASYGEPVIWGGNAKDWLYNAASAGYKTGRVPSLHSIVVTNENRRYGHVAVVEKITGDKILVSEMNFYGRAVVDQRWIDLDSGVIRGYIY